MKKRFATLVFASICFIASTQLHAKNNPGPRLWATVISGSLMTGGGVYWLVKNPKKKEGLIKRCARTLSGVCLLASGLCLILHSEQLLDDIDQNKINPNLFSLFTNLLFGSSRK